MDSLKFYIIVTGFNCRKYVKKCYESVINQSYDNFQAVFIDDGSTDGTHLEFNNFKDKRVVSEKYDDNMGAAKRRYDFIQNIEDKEAVILLLGMDDELLPSCLERVKIEYDNGKLMTYGNWIDQYGLGLPKWFLNFDEHTHENRSYRQVTYRSTAPNTFKRRLFDYFSESDFKYRGQWVNTTTESNLMLSLLEMCGKDRIGKIEEPIYMYNRDLPNGTLKRLGSSYKKQVYNYVKSLPKRDLI